jgi:hypothetical protein
MAATTDATKIFARVSPEFRAEIKAEAVERFEGNEGAVIREAARTYLRLRRKLGPQYEPTLALLLGDSSSIQEKASAA